MQYQHIGYRVKGFYHVANKHVNKAMNDEIAAWRLRALEFWNQHGLAAAMDYCGKSRRTLCYWKKSYREGGLGRLMPRSKAPRTRRRRQWSPLVVAQIRYLRRLLPNLGKEQVHVLLRPWCQKRNLACPSASTIGRLIKAAPDRMRVSPPALTAKGKRKPYRRRQHNYRPKNYRPQHIGECIGMDAIERRMRPLCRYLLTYIDEVSDYAIAAAVPRLNSKTAADFFQRCFQLTPFAVKQVVTDGGGEFKGDFDQLLKNSAITHLYTYPKSPKMNAVCERFNRTIQEQFVDFHEHLLFEDLPLFNQKLADWLVQYNALRPHKALQLKTPVQYISDKCQLSNMWWTVNSTLKCNFPDAGKVRCGSLLIFANQYKELPYETLHAPQP